MAAPTVVAVYSSFQGDGGNSGNGVTTDAAPTTGDYLVVCLCGSANADAMTKPDATWTEVSVPDNSIATGGGAIRAYWKKNPAASTTYTWTLSSGRRSAIGVLVRGADGTTLVDVASSLQSVPGTNHTPPSVTTTGADRLIIDFAGLRQFSPDTANWSVPASGLTWTEQADIQGADTNNNIRLAAGTATAASAGPVSTAVWTNTDPNEESIIIRIAVTPAAGSTATFDYAGPYTGPAPGRISPTGRWMVRPADSSAESQIALSDTGSSNEALGVTATASLPDTGSGADSLAVVAAVSLNETGSSSETLSTTAAFPLGDAGTGTEAITVSATAALADTATAVDDLTSSTAAPLADAGAAADTLAAAAVVSLGDTASAVDTLTTTVAVAFTDAGSAGDALLAGIGIFPTDTGTAADTIDVTAATPLTDAGGSAETLAVASILDLTDGGTASDTLTVTVATVLSDTGAAAEDLTSSALALLTDGGAAVDAFDLAVQVFIIDTGAAIDSLTGGEAAEATVPARYVQMRAVRPQTNAGTSRPQVHTGAVRPTIFTGTGREAL